MCNTMQSTIVCKKKEAKQWRFTVQNVQSSAENCTKQSKMCARIYSAKLNVEECFCNILQWTGEHGTGLQYKLCQAMQCCAKPSREPEGKRRSFSNGPSAPALPPAYNTARLCAIYSPYMVVKK